MILWLIGMMGSGKTTVGRLLAGAAEVAFYDTDIEVESRAGTDIAAIWAEGGEGHFRSLEAEVIAEVAEAGTGVVATGGGAVMNPDTRLLISNSGRVVWLRAEPAELVTRLRGMEGRPLLPPADDIAPTIRELVERRAGVYQSLADQIIDVGGRAPESIAAEIGEQWKS